MMDSHSTHDNGPDSVSYGGGVANPQQQQQQSPAESNLGLPDVVYGFMLLLSNVSALLAFTVNLLSAQAVTPPTSANRPLSGTYPVLPFIGLF